MQPNLGIFGSLGQDGARARLWAPFPCRISRGNEPLRAMHRPPRDPSSMRFRKLPPLLVLAAIVAAIPAAAQFYPPRPPRDVDTAPDDQPPPQQYPQQYPQQQYPRQQYPQYPQPPGGGVQSAPLPPPGASQPLPPPGRDQVL